MTKKEFKDQVMIWLAENNVNFTGKIRVYDIRRYGLEVRFYGQPMEIQNSKKSRRKMTPKEIEHHGGQFNSSFGTFSRIVSNYIYINEDTFTDDEEKEFFLQSFKYL